MSDLDLTAATREASFAFRVEPLHYGSMSYNLADFERAMRVAVETAAPLIAAQVREQIAQEIETAPSLAVRGSTFARTVAARIARGGAR